MKHAWLAFVAVVACAAPDLPPPQIPATAGVDPEVPAGSDAAVTKLADAPAPDAPLSPAAPEVWLKGSTHVHARPSGDSSEPVDKVIAWYETHGYDFIVLTDHNRVSEVAGDTTGKPAVRAPDKGLIVLAGSELTHNPSGCLPEGHPTKRCRIHVNVIAPAERPVGKIEWAERKSHQRIDMYAAALVEAHKLGAPLVQINHPQWYWGMTGDLLFELANRGVRLFEIANAQFVKWNVGDANHPSTEALWDDALTRGATIWGVASDDAHDYTGKGKWPAGGGWIVVHARRDPQAIVDAIEAGHFYASTGVVLSRADVEAGELVVEVAAGERGTYDIVWTENGVVVATDHARTARRAIPSSGYVRARITRDDGKQAWVQPARIH